MLWLACAAPVLAQYTIKIEGSDTMLLLNRELGSQYAADRPEVRMQVQGLGSNTGVAALLEGRVPIGASSRPLKPHEIARFKELYGVEPEEIIVARDALAVYVHNNNMISQLTVDQLQQLLVGDIRNWKEVGGHDQAVVIYNRNKLSGTRVFM